MVTTAGRERIIWRDEKFWKRAVRSKPKSQLFNFVLGQPLMYSVNFSAYRISFTRLGKSRAMVFRHFRRCRLCTPHHTHTQITGILDSAPDDFVVYETSSGNIDVIGLGEAIPACGTF